MTPEALKHQMDEASKPLAETLAQSPPRVRRSLHLHETIDDLDYLDDLIAEHADTIAARGGDIEAVPEIAELLAFAEENFEAAVERWGLKIRTLQAEAQGIELERDRLQAMLNQKTNAVAKLKEYLHRQLDARGIGKVKCPLVTVRIQRSPPSVVALSETIIEELFVGGSPFVHMKTEYVLERAKVLEAEKNGEEIPEGILVRRGTHLRVE